MQKLRLLVVCFAMGAIPMMAQAEDEVLHCLDGVDNDDDGKTDCDDDMCKNDAVCVAAADAQKKQEDAEDQRRLRPFKVKAATEVLNSAKKDEIDARKRIAENPLDEAAQKALGAAIALQTRLRSELIGMGAWASSPKPIANSAPRVAPVSGTPAPAAPASTAPAATPVAVAICPAPASLQPVAAPPSTAARINYTAP